MKHIIIFILLVANVFAQEGTVMIEVSYNKDNFKIQRAWKIPQTFPPTSETSVSQKSDIIIELKDNTGKIVDHLRLADPRIIRGVFSKDSEDTGHTDHKNKKGSFVLRYKYDEGLKYLKIINAKSTTTEEIKQETYLVPNKKILGTSKDMEFGSMLK